MEQKHREFIEGLVLQYSEKLAQLAFRFIGNRKTAEDLVQETFLTACYRIDTLFYHEKPEAWLIVTLRNLARRELARARNRDVPLPPDDMLAGPGNELPMSFYLPEELTEEEREILLLRIEKGYTYAELAEYLGLYEPACRKRYSRALSKCRVLMGINYPVKK